MHSLGYYILATLIVGFWTTVGVLFTRCEARTDAIREEHERMTARAKLTSNAAYGKHARPSTPRANRGE